MKLAIRFSLVMMGIVVLVLAGQAAMRVNSQVESFRADMRRDHQLIGATLVAQIVPTWERRGPQATRTLIDRADRLGKRVDIRLVGLERVRTPNLDQPLVDAAQVEALLLNQRAGSVHLEDDRGEALVTYVPVTLPGAGSAALELTEHLDAERQFVRRALVSTALATLSLALLLGLAAVLFGRWFLGRPVEALCAKARRVGEGDLSEPLQLDRNDEIGEISAALDEMCLRLERFELRLQSEHEAREEAVARLRSVDTAREQLASEVDALTSRLQESMDRLAQESRARMDLAEQLRHADRLSTLGILTSTVAHEMGTPLNVVSLHARMIADGSVKGGDALEGATTIVEQIDRMTDLIRQLLDFARAKRNERQRVDVAALARRTTALLAPLAMRSKVRMEVEPDQPVEAKIEVGAFQQVLLNLTMNGIQAMEGRGGRLRIVVRLDPASTLVVSVEDEGDGIRQENLPLLFKPFYTTKDPSRGTGLGLSVCEQIVHDHGGKIEVESRPGKGSVFTFWLAGDVKARPPTES